MNTRYDAEFPGGMRTYDDAPIPVQIAMLEAARQDVLKSIHLFYGLEMASWSLSVEWFISHFYRLQSDRARFGYCLIQIAHYTTAGGGHD